jgi:hypothetical protein
MRRRRRRKERDGIYQYTNTPIHQYTNTPIYTLHECIEDGDEPSE